MDSSYNAAPTFTERPAHFNVQEFRQSAHQMVDFISDYYRDIESYPVRSQVEPGYLYQLIPPSAPEDPETLRDVLQDVKSKVLPGITHWLSPQFHAYYPASFSTAGYLGEMLCGALNVNGFSWIASPAATELEIIVVDWLGKLLQLPKEFLYCGGGAGVIEGTACEAVLVCLVAARKARRDELVAKGVCCGEIDCKLTVYTSDQTHSSVAKACLMAGILEGNLRVLPTNISSDYALSPAILRRAVQDDITAGFIPFFVCGTIGTTSSSAVDPVAAIGDIAREFDLWFHVDGAYAGNACVCPEFRGFLDGIENADSFCLNPHKWLLVNFDSSCLFVKNLQALERALSVDPEYLKNQHSESKQVVDFRNLQVTLSRRFRAVKLWMVMRMYGANGLRAHIRHGVEMAKYFESLVRQNRHFEVVAPRNFALVCFRLKPLPNDTDNGKSINQLLLNNINSRGSMFLTHTTLEGAFVLRMAIGSTMTEMGHIADAWAIIWAEAGRLLGIKTANLMTFFSNASEEMMQLSNSESDPSDDDEERRLQLEQQSQRT